MSFVFSKVPPDRPCIGADDGSLQSSTEVQTRVHINLLPTIPPRKHNEVYSRVKEAQENTYTHQTGAFPVRPRQGNRYRMILVEVDHSIINSEPTQSRTSGKLTKSYQALNETTEKKGNHTKKHILDNECSRELKDAIMKNNVEYELVPKGRHQRNIS